MGFIRTLIGIAVGIGAGYAAGRLNANQPGSELQETIRARYDAMIAEAEKASEQKRVELENRFAGAKRSGTL